MQCIALNKDLDSSISIFLAQNIQNLFNLREKALSGKLDCCLVKPALVVDPLQIAVAASKAVLNERACKLITKSLNSELLFNISPFKNIVHSLQTFGSSQTDRECLVVVFGGEDKAKKIKSEIEGEFPELLELKKYQDEKAICKIYKIGEEELKVSSLADSVVSRIAVKELDLARY